MLGAMVRAGLISVMFVIWLYIETTEGPAGTMIVSRVRVFPVDDVAVIIVEPAACGVIVPLVVAVATKETLDVIATFVYGVETVNAVVVV